MPTRNVALREHQHDVVQAGRYQNASEVLREGLRLIEQRERVLLMNTVSGAIQSFE